MKNALIITPKRDAYSVQQLKTSMTVKQLRDYLAQFNGDMEIYFQFDGGYTFGNLNHEQINQRTIKED